jgi:CBS domain-containing protein
LTIRGAFSRIFKRAYPAIDPDTRVLPAISLLKFHEIDTLPIRPNESTSKPQTITGYSVLAKFSALVEQRSLKAFLQRPCTEAAMELSSLGPNESLLRLFQAYRKSRFGYAMIEAGGSVGMVSLADTLELYETEQIASDLTVGDVASKIYEIPGERSLSEALAVMFARRIRRIFVDGGDAFVSDRSIIGQVFSSDIMNSILRGSRNVLQMSMNEMEKVRPERVDTQMSIRAAALRLKDKRDQCFVCEKGVITPWDLIMKPWIANALVERGS